MPLQADCPKCSKSYKLPSKYAGKKVSCKECDTVFRVAEIPVAKPYETPEREQSDTEPSAPLGVWIEHYPPKKVLYSIGFLIIITFLVSSQWRNEKNQESSSIAQSVGSSNQTNRKPSLRRPRQPAPPPERPAARPSPSRKNSNKRESGFTSPASSSFNNDYVVRGKITKFPENFSGHSPYQMFEEIKRLPFEDKKGEFETSEAFAKRMKAIWSNATLLGKPTSSRFVFVRSASEGQKGEYSPAKVEYDADSQEMRCQWNVISQYKVYKTSSDVGETDTDLDFCISDSEHNYGRIDSQLFRPTIEPDKARELKDKIRIAMVFRLGTREKYIDSGNEYKIGWFFSPRENDAIFIGQDLSRLIPKNGTFMGYSETLHLAEPPEFIVFNYDTGEIIKRRKYETQTDRWRRVKEEGKEPVLAF